MCRGCCCGTVRKHPDVEHEVIARIVREGLDGIAEVVETECLWACDLSNVVVVNPSAAARAVGARPAWVARVNTPARARDVVRWVAEGGPGPTGHPTALDGVHTAAGLRRLAAERSPPTP